MAAILVSSVCWYLSNGLHGDYWFLLWIAPVPILLLSFKMSAKNSFLMGFLTYFLGRLCWFSWLADVVSLVPTIIFLVILSLIFAFIIIGTRSVVIKTHAWYAVFAYPLFFCLFEWLLITFSPHGTAFSIAYSQMNVLPFIQVASITGILGITFLVSLAPSAIALGWHFRKEKIKLLLSTGTPLLLLLFILIYGFFRLSTIPESDTISVGMVVLDENTHFMNIEDAESNLQHTKNYIQEIDKLAERGATLIVLPERAFNIRPETDSVIMGMLRSSAKKHHIGIVAGYTNYLSEKAHNSALAINEQGQVVTNYHKAKLIMGLEDQFTPGDTIGIHTFLDHQMGTAICKDLDFPDYISSYGKNKVDFVCIPAWDFVVDDWLHSRMAILRGVENGFSEVRTARLGRLTISDPYGRILAEANASHGKLTTLVGDMPINSVPTFYATYGDWFGTLILLMSVILLLKTIFKRQQTK
ncbi:apolipoprotein N-acyltransferase [Confluentibacter citreus]|uniref:apolipoprotein N-acyltransferase n=1 Tax=Confluentibacter citreus TaxID=2007307 RepID=UPI0012FE36B2|nr:nitrilase-related carbon-nitrogen hydrolase [Confluentibacter citreus]